MRSRVISLFVVLAVVLVVAPGAGAATFTVDSAGGGGSCPGTCTLEAAIKAANSVTAGGAPPTIRFGPAISSIALSSSPPSITRNGTFVDGCGVGRTDPPFLAPKPPVSAPCVGLVGTGATAGLKVTAASGVVIQGLAMTGFPSAIHLWGADAARIGGNRFGIRIDGAAAVANGTAVRVTGKTDGATTDEAKGNLIGGPSSATADQACDAYCNVIVRSTTAGIDLVGTPPTIGGDGDAPAGGATDVASDGTSIMGNWIGVYDDVGNTTLGGVPVANAVAVNIGGAHETIIGGPQGDRGNVIAGNTAGVDQGNGATAVTLLGGVYGISPDGDTSVPNVQWNARLHGGGFGLGPFVQGVTFGPSVVGLEINGSNSNVLGSIFRSPDDARFTTAALKIGPGGDRAFIGSNTGATPPLCIPSLTATCNTIGATAPGAPGIWINGADDASVLRTSIGFLPAAPLDGPPIRIDGASTGAIIGDDEYPGMQNKLVRTNGPAIEVSGTASKIVIAGNGGLSVGQFNQPAGLFTDLLPSPGPGNTGPVNGGIQPPIITQASANGVGGTALPGATVRVLVQQRAPVIGDPDPGLFEGETYPSTPAVTTANADGIWGVAFPTALKVGQKLMASQTTADGSSEYASPQVASEDNPSPVVRFTSGPAGVVETRSASFTFVSSKVGSSFQCSLDGGAFVACSSPFTLNGLDIGGHLLQVRATDPIGKQGPPASRTWIVLIPEPAATPPAAAAARALRFSSVVRLPSARSCISRRSLRIRVRTPQGAAVKSVVVRIGGRRVASVRRAKSIPVSLKGLRRGRFVLRVTVTLADGRVVKGSRTYRTCAKKKAKRRR